MLSGSHSISSPVMMAAPVDCSYEAPFEASLTGQRQFKKHKVLPRPRHEKTPEIPIQIASATSPNHDLITDIPRSGNGPQPSSPRTLKHQSRRIGSGPDLPPTPPRHSRKSSDNSSGQNSSPSATDDALQTPQQARLRPPTTPPNQKSPPTPDVTPPHHTTRPKLLRPDYSERPGSSTTTAGSQSGSFKTAREEPLSSEDEGKTAAKTSQSTVRQLSDMNARIPKPEALGLALANLAPRSEGSSTSKSGTDWGHNDSDWGSVSEVEQEWDHNLQRLVTVKKRPQPLDIPRSNPLAAKVVEPNMITPTQAAKAVRNMPLHQRTETVSSAKGPLARDAEPSGPSSTVTSTSSDARRTSAISTKSTVSTVVEAYLLDTSPKRQRTLRHVRKQTVLRESVDRPPSSIADSQKSDRSQRESRPRIHPDAAKHESQGSNTTFNYVSSGRARRDVWKSGGIPVVVVPDRLSSQKSKSSKEPSLRSRSSRRSSRTASVSPAPNDRSITNDASTVVSRQSRGRRSSVPDDADQRTMDYPPVVPKRSSSLSAPTSRNASRASSLTAESIKLHNALQESLNKKRDEPKLPDIRFSEDVAAPRTLSNASDRDWSHRRLSSDRHDDYLFVKGYGSQNTPFSLASVETNGTNPVVSEALAVQMYPHQNSSLLMVDHSTKPSESPDQTQKGDDNLEVPLPTDSSEEVPATPPQPKFSLDDVDSPLRNPRAPPEPPSHPPAINFIPATPSGTTPAHEKMVQMGNYFEATGEKPPRRPSMVRRAFSRTRRHSIDFVPSRSPSFLSRTLSLSLTRGGPGRSKGMPSMEREPSYPSPDDSPAEEDKLHPFWRPQWSSEDSDDYDDDCEDDYIHFPDEPVHRVYRYPPVDNRPKGPQRSFSARMKRTFAVLPREESYYTSYDWPRTERRTIGRTPSGNLRVMRHRASLDSLRRSYNDEERPRSASDGESKKHFWRTHTIQRRASKERRRLSLGSRLEEIQNLPRKFSEKRREKRSRELRQKISGPREVRDGVGEVIRSSTARDHYRSHGQA
ncbi:hypothetical protein FALBO_11756 [Fusarium albosuccineum]|uniref:Uncharacterized protein n=1 Tax=Fusarium albosuccineum TaxID=1237068 RepID=A0A8H4L201_9HYPO|nr:hypothetical protein FALBO_11756 [Fusarium albosuccineum]